MNKPRKYYISIGSNMSNRKENLQKAIGALTNTLKTSVRSSSIYESEHWGEGFGDDYFNCVVSFQSEISAEDMLKICRNIEREMGRSNEEKGKNGPRIIDLDILLVENLVLKNKDLEIPHPRMHQRNFVLIPLMEIAGHIKHPLLDKTIEELYLANEDNADVCLIHD